MYCNQNGFVWLHNYLIFYCLFLVWAAQGSWKLHGPKLPKGSWWWKCLSYMILHSLSNLMNSKRMVRRCQTCVVQVVLALLINWCVLIVYISITLRWFIRSTKVLLCAFVLWATKINTKYYIDLVLFNCTVISDIRDNLNGATNCLPFQYNLVSISSIVSQQ